MASAAQPSKQEGGAVTIEPLDGHYDCFSCLESIRLDLKEAKAGGNDGNGAVLKCTVCTAPPFHAQCVGIQHRTKCGVCRKLTVQPWSPWTQAGPVGGAIAVPDDGPDADPDQKEGGQSVPVHDGKAAAGGKRAARKSVKFLPFSEAVSYARSLLLKNRKEWKVWCKSDRKSAARAANGNVPSNPERTYKHEGWQGYGHWLGTGNIHPSMREYLPFKKALLYARSLKLKGVKDWAAWNKSGVRPENVPCNPHKVFKHEGWQGYGHWLGTGNIKNGKQKYLPFAEALLYARSLKLKSMKYWEAWRKTSARPANLPSCPDVVYKQEGWQGYGHWLGTGNLAKGKQEYLPFAAALLYARSLKLKTQKAWQAWSKSDARPANVPSTPQKIYNHEGWQGYGHWLGTGNIVGGKQECLAFKEALHAPSS